MRKSFKILSSALAISLLLTGCMNSKFEEEAQRVKEQKEEMKKKEKEKEKENKNKKKQDDIYKELEKPLEEVILENDLDAVKEMPSLEVEEKPNFEDAAEFAKYAGKMLYLFYTQQITPEQYYDFQINYGSSQVIDELPTEKDAINILTSLQDMFKKQNITGEEYKITEPQLDRLKRNATFYRKILTTNGKEYFITTITKEDEGWKYVEDSPSPPYQLPEVQNTEE